MDPNAALKKIRDLVETMDGQPDEMIVGMAEELAVLVQGLDEWLSKGGFLPKAWQR